MQKSSMPDSVLRGINNLRDFVAGEATRPDGPIVVIEPPTKTPHYVVSNDALEYWGEFYTSNNFKAFGMPFHLFMENPRAISNALVYRLALPIRSPAIGEFYPLLPKQRLAIARIGKPNKVKPISDLIFLKRQAD